ncbi:MAG TPA: hypothetical protein VHU91_05950 [Mycobacteriales bacterium]|nr:hypothetical protein [Mycobacteriales bacterium]
MRRGVDTATRRWLIPVRSLWQRRSARGWALLLAVTVVGTASGAGAGWWATGRVAQEYTASAVYSVDHIAPDMAFLSFSKPIEAEQAAKVLNRGLSARLAAATAGPHARYDATWVVGPAPDQVSFRVRSQDAALTHRIAVGVFHVSGPSGRQLLRPEQPRPGIAAEKTTEPMARYHLGKSPIMGAAAIGAFVSVGMFLLFAMGNLRPIAARQEAPAE